MGRLGGLLVSDINNKCGDPGPTYHEIVTAAAKEIEKKRRAEKAKERNPRPSAKKRRAR